jgi:DNA repair protein RadA/Sms
MARTHASFVCQACGAVSNRWAGRCEACGGWNTIAEEAVAPPLPGGGAPRRAPGSRSRDVTFEGLASGSDKPAAPRLVSGIGELDRVTGGGFVPGSALLLAGEPGIGKSTLLIQAAAALARRSHRAVYVSGEEAAAQVRLRAERLGLAASPVELAAETQVDAIVKSLARGPAPGLLVIDSIQTMWTEAVESAPGTVTQVRSSAQALIRYAKTSGAAVVLAGHVTKDGQIAGPRVVEHMVDAVLAFEGEHSHAFRILRAQKNRFGPTDEIGVVSMTGAGLEDVENPSALFLSGRDLGAPGVAVFAGMEGTRPLLVEIQALVAPTTLATPRRAVVGWDQSRLAMVLAVLDAHAGLRFGQHDVYLNVAGGLRVQEPAADIAVAAALVSSASGTVLASDTVFFGEISLSGSVRPVVHAALRAKEAGRLGFARAVAPAASLEALQGGPLSLHGVGSVEALTSGIVSREGRGRRAAGDEA